MADQLTTQTLAAALAREFGAALEVVLGQAVTVAAGTAIGAHGWATPVTASGALTGTLTACLDGDGAQAVATRMMALEDEPEESVVADMLRELWTQAAAATALRSECAGLVLAAGTPRRSDIEAGGELWRLQAAETALATIAVVGLAAPGAVGLTGATSAGPAERRVDAASRAHVAALLDIELPLVVRFARTEVSLRELTQLGPGSMVDMGRSPDDPVQLLVGSQVIAEGEVVVVAGNYGVRILSLVSPAERLRAMDL